MNTKLVSQWRLPKNTVEKLGLQPDVEAMGQQLMAKDLRAFLADSGELSSPFGQLLQACFAKVADEFNAERWIKLPGNIFVDKQAKGYWIINKDFGRYNSGTSVVDVEKAINAEIKDKVNSWKVAPEAEMKCLYQISSTFFYLTW